MCRLHLSPPIRYRSLHRRVHIQYQKPRSKIVQIHRLCCKLIPNSTYVTDFIIFIRRSMHTCHAPPSSPNQCTCSRSRMAVNARTDGRKRPAGRTTAAVVGGADSKLNVTAASARAVAASQVAASSPSPLRHSRPRSARPRAEGDRERAREGERPSLAAFVLGKSIVGEAALH